MMTEERTPEELPTRPPRLQVSVETIPPEMAELYLSVMNNPRKLREPVVIRYARDMTARKWHVGTSAISFDDKGVLRDGQHRLQAVILSGVPLETVVHRNVDEGAVLNMDRGLKRMWSDHLKARGIHNAGAVQSSVTLAWRWDHGLFAFGAMRNAATYAELEDWLDAHPGFEDYVQQAVHLRGQIGSNVAAMAAFMYRTSVIDPGASSLFFELLDTGDVPPANPIRKLRDRTLANHSRRRGSLSQITELAVSAKTWNAWVQGRTFQHLSWRRGPSVRESFPDLEDAHGNVYPFPDVVAEMEEGDE